MEEAPSKPMDFMMTAVLRLRRPATISEGRTAGASVWFGGSATMLRRRRFGGRGLGSREEESMVSLGGAVVAMGGFSSTAAGGCKQRDW